MSAIVDVVAGWMDNLIVDCERWGFSDGVGAKFYVDLGYIRL